MAQCDHLIQPVSASDPEKFLQKVCQAVLIDLVVDYFKECSTQYLCIALSL